MNRVVREFFLGFVRLHILHHAKERPVYGAWLRDELAKHGYEIGPGTLYPILHTLEYEGLLRSTKKVEDGRFRRCYVLTPKGEAILEEARFRIRELLEEIFGEENPKGTQQGGLSRSVS